MKRQRTALSTTTAARMGGAENITHHGRAWRPAGALRSIAELLLALSMAPIAEARLVGGGARRLTQEMAQNQFSPITATAKHEENKREDVSAKFEAKYPSMAAEIRRRRQQQQNQQQQKATHNDENVTAKSRGLQSTTQQLTVAPTNDGTRPLVTLTLRKQASSSSSSSPVDTMLQNEVSNLKAIKGLNQRGAQTLDVEFLLDRPERQARTKFRVQMNLVALAMGRTDGLTITAEEADRTVNGSVNGIDKLIISENPNHGAEGGSDGDGEYGHPKHDGLHLMAVAPPSKPPASLGPPLIDETLLPP